MTQKGLFIFTDTYGSEEKLEAINGQGKTEYTIKLSTPSRIYGAFDAELLNDNTVAVTTGDPFVFGQCRGISVVDLTSRKVIKFIDLPDCSYGITHDGNSLICCVTNSKIHVVSCTDYSITTVPNTIVPRLSYISTNAGKIYFTNPEENRVSCCLYDGKHVWDFCERKVLEQPHGITVDDKGYVFVVGSTSCNVLVISPDGKRYKEILNKDNGLIKPIAISIYNLRNHLLVTNENNDAHLYKISYC
ncbi:Hypothetical predicted protein [Mytilus galloprovincialis]|uniref:Uncharacterized protein n=1 Tax=Mytilus galloprovincialis TaxID=29158 RepID=A0A8B6CLX5_MYTGA|nr:Hypothetical predicted protein [Mytilus galloprovincialis]